MVAARDLPRRQPVERARGLGREGGFTLVEFMISALIMTLVLGATVALAAQIQQGYQSQLDDAAVEQEARYALEWIARDLRSAGSDPYNIILEADEIRIDPDAVAPPDDSVRLWSDIFPPDGDADDVGEKITIALNPMTNEITRADANAADPSAIAMTEAIFTELAFTFLNDAGAEEADSTLVTSVRAEVTAQSRGFSAVTQEFPSFTLSTEVRLRVR